MESLVEFVLEKISSYNLFNNLLPGIIFCQAVEHVTKIVITDNSFFTNFFIYYFIGILIGRISSVIVEPILMKIKFKNIRTQNECFYINFAPYEDYVEASENIPFIKILNESCNMYRCFISTFLLIICCKLYDCVFSKWLSCLKIGDSGIIIIVICLLIMLLFIMSYKKQVDYIRKRVEKYIKEMNQ